MKKIYLLGLSVAVTAFTFAQNREVIGQEKNWERLELSQDRSEDTLSPASMNDPCILNGFTLYTSGDGYVAGMNDYGDIGKGQLYPLNGSADVVGALVFSICFRVLVPRFLGVASTSLLTTLSSSDVAGIP